MSIRQRLLALISSENGVLILLMLFGLLLRLYKITNPFLDYHCPRQATTATIARNFLYNGFKILYPQIDHGGAGPGYVETEFQLVPFIAAFLYQIFGLHEFIARLVIVAFSIGSIYLFYRLVRKFCDRRVSTISTIFFTIAPLNIYLGRAFMPESAMIFFSIGSVLLFHNWLETGSWRWFTLACLFTTLALLVKIPTLLLALPLLWLAYSRYGRGLFRQWKLYVFAALVLILPALWYYHAHTVLAQWHTFGIWELDAKWGRLAIWMDKEFYKTLFLRLSTMILTPIGLTLFIVGLFIPVASRKEYVFHFWVLAVLAYFMLIAKGNWVHDYYQLPLVPVASVFVGKALAGWPFTKFRKSFVSVLLIIVMLASVATLASKAIYGIDKTQYNAGLTVDRIARKDALVMAGDGPLGMLLYYCNRKGWKTSLDCSDTTKELVESLKAQGLEYFVTTKIECFTDDFRHYLYENSQVITGQGFIIFDLTGSKPP